MTKVTINRLPTGVPGLDEVLGGGLPEFSFNLIAGQPGCGKTTLAHQIMFSLATPERPALYFTVLGEPPLKMLRYQQQFSFFDGEALNRAVRFISLSEDAMSGDLDRVLRRIVEEVTQYGPALVFVDSFRSVVLASQSTHQSHNNLQQFVQQLGMLMTSWQATTFLIGEYFSETDANPVFTVADGLIWMRQSVYRNSVVRKMEIVKMRGQCTLPGLHTFRMGAAGLEVFVPACGANPSASHPAQAAVTPAAASAGRSDPASRLAMGVPGLDDMLGGGLPCGYSLLVAGPSGSGKSILAAAFLAEGARAGETGVIAVFEQHPNRSRNRTVADLIASGQVGVVDSRAPDLSIDEIITLLLREVKRLKATRVVIDSLSGFELSVAPTFREDFRESLMRLVTALAATGVTVLMTSELEDRYTDLRFSPYGTAFLTDAIIVHRYIEIDSRFKRVMAVMKLRASAHSDALREFHIDADGIHLGALLADHEGLLGGHPARTDPPPPVPPKSAVRAA
jgi:circadian clock protein KaiC